MNFKCQKLKNSYLIDHLLVLCELKNVKVLHMRDITHYWCLEGKCMTFYGVLFCERERTHSNQPPHMRHHHPPPNYV